MKQVKGEWGGRDRKEREIRDGWEDSCAFKADFCVRPSAIIQFFRPGRF